MKISQLIKKLESFQKKNGDLPVSVLDPDALTGKNGEVRGAKPILCPWYEDETRSGKPHALVLIDPETALSLS